MATLQWLHNVENVDIVDTEMHCVLCQAYSVVLVLVEYLAPLSIIIVAYIRWMSYSLSLMRNGE